MKKRLVLTTAIAICSSLIPSSSAYADEAKNIELKKNSASTIIGVGANIAKLVINANDKPARLLTDTPDAKLNASRELLNSYVSNKHNNQVRMDSAQYTGDLVQGVAVTATSYFGSPLVGAIVADVIGEAKNIALTEFSKTLEKDLKVSLAAKKSQLASLNNVPYDELRKKDVKEIKNILKKSTDIYTDLKEQYGNEEIAKVALDLQARQLKDTTLAALDAIDINTDSIKIAKDNVKTLSSKFYNFQTKVSRKFEEHTQRLDELDTRLGKVEGRVITIEKSVMKMGKNQAIISDFIFGKMSATQKLRALNSGFMSERFECSEGIKNCDGTKLKKKLVSQFEDLSRIETLTADIGKYVSGINDINSIANNLGVDIPVLDDFTNIANAGFGAYSALIAVPPNYLSALNFATGIFSKSKPDPDAERFKILMGYLDKQFKQINKKLEEIIARQKLIEKKIDRLSEQIRLQYEVTDERLQNIEWEVKTVNQTVKQIYAEQWAPCWSIADSVYRAKVGKFTPNEGYASFNDIVKVSKKNGNLYDECLSQLKGMSRISDQNFFGNFLPLNTALNFDQQLYQNGFKDRKHLAKGQIQAFTEDTYLPLLEMTEKYLSDYKDLSALGNMPSTTLSQDDSKRSGLVGRFYTLTSPSDTIVATKTFDDRMFNISTVCFNERNSSKMNVPTHIQYLFRCMDVNDGDIDESEYAKTLLKEPIHTESLIKITEMMDVFIPLTDIRYNKDGDTDYARDAKEFIAIKSSSPIDFNYESDGETLTLYAIMGLNLAVANESLLYGQLSAQSTIHALNHLKEDSPLYFRALHVLETNHFLARNTSNVFLWEKWGQRATDLENVKTQSKRLYRNAIEFALDLGIENQRFKFLENLFGEEVAFRIYTNAATNNQTIQFNFLNSAEQELWLDLPLVEELFSRELVYPKRLEELRKIRERYIEQLTLYQLFKTDSDDPAVKDEKLNQAQYLVTALWEGDYSEK